MNGFKLEYDNNVSSEMLADMVLVVIVVVVIEFVIGINGLIFWSVIFGSIRTVLMKSFGSKPKHINNNNNKSIK